MYYESIDQLNENFYHVCLFYNYFIFCHIQLCHANDICHLIDNLGKISFRLYDPKFL